MSLIENSLEKLRRAAIASKDASASAVGSPNAASVDQIATLEPRYIHRRIAVHFADLRAQGYLPEESQQRRFADCCHRLKRPLITRALAPGVPQDTRLILLSSAVPGDGKSFLALNLALSMARERDISVLLVDADLPKAQITRVLGMQGQPGLLDALQDPHKDVESLVVETDVANLEVLPAGPPSDGAAELVASERMREIAARLLSRNPRRLVLFDSPPLLLSSEARALLPIPGQIVLVARTGHTPRRAIVDALSLVDKAKLQGLILNDADVRYEHAYYDYGSYGAGETGSKRP